MNKVAAPGQPSNAPALNWKVAALGAAALAVSAAIQPTGLGALAAGLVAVAIVSLAQRWPVSAGCAMLALFLVVSANETVRSPVVVFSVPFLVASQALAGHLRAAAAFAVALGYVCVTSPFTGQWLPYDLSGTVIFAATLAAGLWAGAHLRRQRLQHRAQQRRLEEEMEQRREQLTRALHDSVATTLTSVVMRAETLGLSAADSPAVQETSELIAEETRQAMQEVRHLIQVTRVDDALEPEPAPIDRTISDQVSVTARLLRSHGFTVEGDASARGRRDSFPAGFERVFAEMATNAMKYARPGSEIRMALEQDGANLRFTMSNEASRRRALPAMTSGFGLKQSARLVAHHGGTFSAGVRDGRWAVVLELPVTALFRPDHTPIPGGDFRAKVAARHQPPAPQG